MEPDKKHWNTVIIGAGQSGLAVGYFLKKLDIDFVILDRNKKTGESWRRRWDSLLLFSPSQYDGLPGMPFPASRGSYPTKDQMADYLENYASVHSLPVKHGMEVIQLSANKDHYEIKSSTSLIEANKVIIATGTNPIPKIPAFASDLDAGIFQVHSSAYTNPGFIPDGDVLVVGGGTSGVEIALEVSKTHKTFLSGKPTFHIPDPVFKYAGRLYWWFVSNILTVNTPVGKKARTKILHGGAPLIRVSPEDLDKAGVGRLPRVTGVKDGLPQFEDGRILNFASVIWATGYKPDFSWVSMNITDDTGWPKGKRGISDTCKGLYFIGMPFQFGLTSGLVGGVGRDAEFISRHIS